MKNTKTTPDHLKSLCRLLLGILIFSLLTYSSSEKTTSSKLKGKVYDAASKEKIIGVSIRILSEDHSLETTTDMKGYYSVDLSAGTYKLTFSHAGYITQEKEINIKTSDEKVVLDVYLKGEKEESEDIVLMDCLSETEGRAVRSSSARRYKKAGNVRKCRMIASPSTYHKYESTKSYERYESDKRDVSGDYDDKSSGEGIAVGAGVLTAGEINDFTKWELWQDIEQTDLNNWQNYWGFTLKERYTLQLTSNLGTPIIDCPVKLVDEKGKLVWMAKTDNTGKAEFWVNIHDSVYRKKENFSIIVNAPSGKNTINKTTQFHKGINSLKIKSSCYVPENLDAVFVVDATGSMGDEIEFLKAELNDVIKTVKEKNQDVSINLGSVFYRDEGDEYVTRESALSSDISKTVDFIQSQSAGGGGDFPEAMDAALEKAINNMEWSKEARARIIFLVLDAPPHYEKDVVDRIKVLTSKAAAMGIRIVPVTGSGIDKSTEYLMRSMALATNGTYVFLTDHSGVGNPHIEPTTDEYDVEKLNEVLIRIFDTYSAVTECGQSVIPEDETIKDTVIVTNSLKSSTDTTNSSEVDSIQIIDNPDIEPVDSASTDFNVEEEFSWKFYPNPTRGQLWIEIDGNIGELYLADVSGKIMERYRVYDQQKIQLDISSYPVGFYFIKYYMEEKDKWLSGKVIRIP